MQTTDPPSTQESTPPLPRGGSLSREAAELQEDVLVLFRLLEDLPQPEDVLPTTSAVELSEPAPGWLAEFDAVLQQTLFTDLGLPVLSATDPSAVDLLLNELLQGQAPEPIEVPLSELPAESEVQPPDEAALEPTAPVAEPSLGERFLAELAEGSTSQEDAEEGQGGRASQAGQTGWDARPASVSLREEPELLPPDLVALACPPDPGKPYLLFGLAGAEYAVALSHVLEIRNPPAVTPLPQVPEWVRGVSNLGGNILAVVDLRAFLGLPEADASAAVAPGDDCGSPRKRLLIVHSPREELTTGLLVDGTRTICRFPDERITALTIPVEGAMQPYLLGQAEARPRGGTSACSGVLRILDLERLLEKMKEAG